jgi:uncharacterized membrane protein YbhN (UPF0104 family)
VSRRKILSLAVSLALSAFLLAALFRQVRAEDIGDALRGIHPPGLALYAAVSLAAVFLRSWRYRLLLEPGACGWGPMILVTMARNAFEDLLPARVGSLSYIYLLDARVGVAFESAASSFLAAFVVDFLTLGPFVALAVLSVGGSSRAAFPAGLLLALAAGFFLAMALIWAKLASLLALLWRGAERAARRFKATDQKGWRRADEKARATIASLEALRARGLGLPVLGLSLLIRLAKYASLFALVGAVLRSYGLGPAEIGFGRLILVLTGAEMTSAFPIKGLADFGTWETAWAIGFKGFGFAAGLAAVSGFGVHLVTAVFEAGLGLVGLLLLTARRRPRTPPRA